MTVYDKILEIANSAKKLTGPVARQIVQTWLDQWPMEQSFRSKYRKRLVDTGNLDTEERSYIRRTSLVTEKRHRVGGRWGAWNEVVTGLSLVEAAVVFIRSAVIKTGQATPSILAQRDRDLARSKQRAASKENLARGIELATKELASNHYDELFAFYRTGKPIDPEIIKKMKRRGEFFGVFIFGADRESLLDDAFVSIDKPPFLPMYRRMRYFWIEKINDVDYSFSFEYYAQGMMAIQIADHARRMSRGGTFIEGHIKDTGAVDYGILGKSKNPSLIADITRIWLGDGSGDGNHIGATMVALWCRITNAFGIKRSMILRPTTEVPLLNRLVEAGKIEVEPVEGSSVMIKCLP